jgi:hypothetical protein
MSQRETATSLLAQKTLIDLMAAANRTAREAAKETDFDRVGERAVGVLGDQELGVVQLNKGRESWQVTDPAAFLQWVMETRPTEVVTHPSVRSSYTSAVLHACKTDGGVVLSEASGEFGPPPGVECKQGEPTLSVKPNEQAAAVVLNALGDAAVPLGLAERAELEQ